MKPSDSRGFGLFCLLVTSVGWGINWPVVKIVLADWPPLFARGLSGIAAAIAIGLLVTLRGESLLVPRAIVPRLMRAAAINVFCWMGLSTLALSWLDAGEGALLVYTMSIWAVLLAWPMQGVKPGAASVAALVLGMAGLAVLLGGQEMAVGVGKLPGVLLALAAAITFALGTVAGWSQLPLSPLVSVTWQVGLGCLPMLAIGLLFEKPEFGALGGAGWAAMTYMTVVPMGLCYLTWFEALRRLPATTASTATLLVPVIGVVAAAVVLGESLGPAKLAALALTLGGVTLAMRESARSRRKKLR